MSIAGDHAVPAGRHARGAAPSLYSHGAGQGTSGIAGDWRHAWRNALFPVITLFGLWLPILVTGSVFVEAVFAWPGLGSLAAAAATSRDYPLLMGTSLLAAGARRHRRACSPTWPTRSWIPGSGRS